MKIAPLNLPVPVQGNGPALPGANDPFLGVGQNAESFEFVLTNSAPITGQNQGDSGSSSKAKTSLAGLKPEAAPAPTSPPQGTAAANGDAAVQTGGQSTEPKGKAKTASPGPAISELGNEIFAMMAGGLIPPAFALMATVPPANAVLSKDAGSVTNPTQDSGAVAGVGAIGAGAGPSPTLALPNLSGPTSGIFQSASPKQSAPAVQPKGSPTQSFNGAGSGGNLPSASLQAAEPVGKNALSGQVAGASVQNAGLPTSKLGASEIVTPSGAVTDPKNFNAVQTVPSATASSSPQSPVPQPGKPNQPGTETASLEISTASAIDHSIDMKAEAPTTIHIPSHSSVPTAKANTAVAKANTAAAAPETTSGQKAAPLELGSSKESSATPLQKLAEFGSTPAQKGNEPVAQPGRQAHSQSTVKPIASDTVVPAPADPAPGKQADQTRNFPRNIISQQNVAQPNPNRPSSLGVVEVPSQKPIDATSAPAAAMDKPAAAFPQNVSSIQKSPAEKQVQFKASVPPVIVTGSNGTNSKPVSTKVNSPAPSQSAGQAQPEPEVIDTASDMPKQVEPSFGKVAPQHALPSVDIQSKREISQKPMALTPTSTPMVTPTPTPTVLEPTKKVVAENGGLPLTEPSKGKLPLEGVEASIQQAAWNSSRPEKAEGSEKSLAGANLPKQGTQVANDRIVTGLAAKPTVQMTSAGSETSNANVGQEQNSGTPVTLPTPVEAVTQKAFTASAPTAEPVVNGKSETVRPASTSRATAARVMATPGGTLDAQQTSGMALTPDNRVLSDGFGKNIPQPVKNDSTAREVEQILPRLKEPELVRSRLADLPAMPFETASVEAGILHGEEAAAGRLSPVLSKVSTEVWSAVQGFRATGANDWELKIRPEQGMQLSVTLKMQDNQLVVHARVESGNWDLVAPHWRDLQVVLADRGVQLKPLEMGNGSNNGNGNASGHNHPSQQFQSSHFEAGGHEQRNTAQFAREREWQEFGALKKPVDVKKPAAPASAKSDRVLETWA